MAFDIKEVPLVKKWIMQFDLVDRYAAELLLQSLSYISFADFEKSIQNQVKEIVEEAQKVDNSCVAIFTVSKNLQHKFNKDKERKPENDSSGRIGHALKNLERNLGKSVELTPRIASMSQKKVRHIIYVDDFIGSGKRFIDFWRKDVSRSVKSWVSGGYCKIWLVSHTIHKEGVEKILKNISAIDCSRVRSQNLIESSQLIRNKKIRDLLVKYSTRTNKSDAALGYGDNCSPVVFQYGCPNNAPAILWANGKPNKKSNSLSEGRWDSLFSERSIDTELYPLFENSIAYQTYPELLWSAGQHKLALKFCDEADENTKLYNLILALSSSGYTRKKIEEVLLPIQKKSNDAINNLIIFGLIYDDMKLSRFGEDVLENNRKHRKIFVDKEYENFYPSSYLGFHREV
ncbi:hypothetical protein CWB60_16205 [Pseudoalteromonas sp. S327]|uniref:phosphoribosyltransferase-like protein n=1 Tax=unclassified Pseudoalteromonas TaxID=194690 RepID=UPI00110B7A6F|nr:MULTISPECIES: hypothetical protein [unclassified Pseudoalteromonas]TMO04462.1 hypothetical protein CWB60_16205 [Pseudoalteromonas sp. S327]TMO16441.1 hypothetical protein CWB59_13245 [Pseudoalteromonas sp. S326]